jgi:hypothetical protein
VTILLGGFDRWLEAGFPTESKLNVDEISASPS